jgi:hypothetical protein
MINCFIALLDLIGGREGKPEEYSRKNLILEL